MAGAGFPALNQAAVAITGGTITGITDLAVADGGTGASTAAGALTSLGFPSPFLIRATRKLRPISATGTGVLTTVANVAYFLYLGYTIQAFTPKYIAAHLHTVSTTDSVGELGFFTTPLAGGCKAGQTLTPIAGAFKTAWDDMTAGGGAAPRRVGNAVAMATQVSAGVHLWAGIRTNTGGNEPTFYGVHAEGIGGDLLTTAAAAAFDGSTTYAGLIPAVVAVNTTPGPYIWAELD